MSYRYTPYPDKFHQTQALCRLAIQKMWLFHDVQFTKIDRFTDFEYKQFRDMFNTVEAYLRGVEETTEDLYFEMLQIKEDLEKQIEDLSDGAGP